MKKIKFNKKLAEQICKGEIDGKIINILDKPVEILKWNANNKDGSIIVNVKDIHGDIVMNINEDGYCFSRNYQIYILINDYDNFDFKPFDKVLVRDSIQQDWTIEIFKRKFVDNDGYIKYECLTDVFNQCIPYEGNESLFLTNKSPFN